MTIARNRPADSAGGQQGTPGGELVPALIAIARARLPQRARRPGDPPVLRLALLVGVVALVVLLANEHGQIFFDTKLGVDLDPAGFYARLWQLWNPNEWLGTLQDQYIGYAFPMGPFYLAGHLLGVPVWVTERLWLALLIAVGFAGLVRLARELEIGTERSRIVAGLAFALWPTVTIVIGSTSAGLLPGLLAPWAVLPLVRAARGGPMVRACAQSGVAVLCMGGVNATSTLDALILPGLYILTQARGRRLVRLAGCWAAAVALATSWWVVPLLLQARYSFNFLPYIEQSATTTGTMDASTFLRGAGNWTAYLSLGQPWLSAGWVMVTTPVAIIAGAIAGGTGLLGMSRRDLPAGGWLRLCLGLTALIALAGYPGPLGGLLHHTVDQLFDGGLAPLRSVYKLEPAAAAVLALGIAHALVLRASRAAVISDPAHRVVWHVLAAPVIAFVLIGLAFPYLSGQVLNPGPFTSVPSYWYQVSDFIRQHSPQAPVLVEPAAAHGTYLWGETVDEPLEPLASSPWVEQGLVPYGGAGSQLLLSSIDAAITSGERTPGLATTLERSGIRYIVVRNDLNPNTLGYVAPQTVHQALASSGFVRVAAFGPLITGKQTDPGAPQIQYALPSYPAVEVFAASSASGTPVPPPAVALPVSRTVLVDGGPDALLQLTGQHILRSAPAVIAGDKLVTRPALWAVTDTLPRADHTFGLTDATPSYTYTAKENNQVADPLGAAGQPPRQLLPVPSAGHQTVAVLAGAASVTASSTGSWLAETPQVDPVNAFDGNPGTFWTEASPTTPVGQWIQITFSHPVALPSSISVRLLVSGQLRPVPDRLTVSTRAGTVTSAVSRTSAPQPLPVAAGLTRTLRVTIAGARGVVPGGPGAGFAGIGLPGVRVIRYSEPAQARAGQLAGDLAFSFHRQVPSPGSLADLAAYPPMAEQFTTRAVSSFRLSASAMVVPGPRLDRLLALLTPKPDHTLEVTASSTYGSLPGFAPASLFNGGSWIAGAPNPVLRLGWQGKRTIRRMVVLPVPGFSAVPESIKIISPNGARFASVGLDGITEIVPPLTTDRMTISFPQVQFTNSAESVSGQPVQLPVGLGELSIPALHGLRATQPVASTKFHVSCASGPRVDIDGQKFRTRVTGTVGDLTDFRPVRVSLCAPGSALELGAGQHRLLAARQGLFTITGLSLITGSAGRGGQARAVSVISWQSDSRQVRIGQGAASYLELHQNANPGWIASLGGRALTPVTLDGWQQGFVVPAGSGGVITLTFAPVKFYHAWIILSAVGALALLVIASARRRRRRVHEAMAPALTSGSDQPEPPVPGLAALPAGLGWPAGLGLAGLSVLILIVGGPAVVVVPIVAVLAYLWPRWYGVLAFGGLIAAGAFAAMAAHPSVAGSGAFGAPAQAFALIALTVALMPVLPGRAGTGWRPRWPGRQAARS